LDIKKPAEKSAGYEKKGVEMRGLEPLASALRKARCTIKVF
jgi:hypothetical protein